MKKTFTTILLLTAVSAFIFAQSPKREMRAVWFTTWLSDFTSTRVPRATGSNEAARQTAITTQKNSLISSLNDLQKENINVVCFHVRPMCDAIYKSSYEPWSQYVSQYRGDDPGWDPLEFVIEEAHKRGMELHPWLNPYRYSQNSGNHGNLATDYPNAHPDWMLNYSTYGKILNPAMPEVIQRISDVVAEIVTNYDVDGIIFDDYFYMSGTTNEMDQAQYTAYQNNNPNNLLTGLNRNDWRRANVNKMVETVYKRIQSIKPYVAFGISPAGVAKKGAAAVGLTQSIGSDWQYDDIYSDPLAWLHQGTIDYISPQIYWPFGHSTNDYGQLSKWWSYAANKFGKHFYSSQNQFGIPEIGNEIDANRNHDLNDASGSIFFRTVNLIGSSVMSYLMANHYRYKALPPAISWKPTADQDLVANLTLTGQNLKWTHSDSVRYVIYAAPKSATNPLTSSLHIQGISYAYQFTLPSGINKTTHRIAVSVMDRYGNEFAPRVLDENPITPAATTLISPANNATVGMSAIFTWEPVQGAAGYVWQLARDAGFNDIISSRETTVAQFTSGLPVNLQDKNVYYWRVKTLNTNGGDVWSEVRSFTVKIYAVVSKVEMKKDSYGNADIQYPINITFSRKMNKASVEAATGIAPAANISFSWFDDYTLKVDISKLAFETAYTLTINGTAKDSEMNNFIDGAGNGIEGSNYALNFTTCEQETDAPVVVSYDPQGIQEESIRPIVRIEFDKPLNESSIAPNQIIVTDKNGKNVDGVQTYHATTGNKSVIHYIFNADLNPQETYKVTLASGLEDLFGNATPKAFTFNFTARPREIIEATMLEEFASLAPAEWNNATQLTGLNVDASSAIIDEDTRATAESAGTLRLTYQWQGGITTGEWRMHAFAESASLPSFTKSANSYIQFYLFGDGSATRFSPVLQRVNISSNNNYYAKPTVMNWVGWRMITWDLNDITGVTYPWLGGSGGVPTDVLCFKSMHTQTAQPLSIMSSRFWVSQVRVVKLGNTITGMKDISTEKASVAAYYDLLGRKLTKEPASGIYIIVYDNGKAVKAIKN